ncbi:hypothetical protein GCM10022223_13330 [Kineosporia mesophila]|uniref:Polyketide cyclase / dehydrase and lipid transport n=1 Tax=Kineosporia mesophila TaxID=566012 RepID=A0ABP6Z6W1_9ACTN|nr:hypothetical protein [Kineosporia mesophila]MCD5354932.1 hypothetical protein [Kineosporia mesophila]
MNAGYELPLPAAQIVGRLNARPRIPLTPWSLKVTEVALVRRDRQVPQVEVVVEVCAVATFFGAVPGEELTGGRWAVRFDVRAQALETGAPTRPFVLLLKVKLEEWWLNRAQEQQIRAVREHRASARRLD